MDEAFVKTLEEQVAEYQAVYGGTSKQLEIFVKWVKKQMKCPTCNDKWQGFLQQVREVNQK